MQKKPLTNDHYTALAVYGIHDIPNDTCCRYFKSGETIHQEGMDIQFLCIVISGQAKVCLTALNGKSLVLCYYVSDGVIGDVELVTENHAATTTIIAVTDFECIAIPFHRNASILKRNITFMNQIGIELAKKLVLSTSNFSSSALCSGEERLCSYILQSSSNDMFHDILTDVVCSVGISYRHLFRILNGLCNNGILEKREFGYQIMNREKLTHKSINANKLNMSSVLK